MNVMLCNLTWKCVVVTGWLSTLIVVAIIMCCYYWLKYSKLPSLKNAHEITLKDMADKKEKEWYDKKNNTENLKASTDESLNKQVKELKNKICELEGKLKTEELAKGILEKQLKMYSEIFKALNVEIKPKEKQS